MDKALISLPNPEEELLKALVRFPETLSAALSKEDNWLLTLSIPFSRAAVSALIITTNCSSVISHHLLIFYVFVCYVLLLKT